MLYVIMRVSSKDILLCANFVFNLNLVPFLYFLSSLIENGLLRCGFDRSNSSTVFRLTQSFVIFLCI